MLFSAVRIKKKIHVSNTHQNCTFCQLHCKSREIKKYNLLHVVQCFGVHVCSVLFRGLCGPSRSQSEKKLMICAEKIVLLRACLYEARLGGLARFAEISGNAYFL